MVPGVKVSVVLELIVLLVELVSIMVSRIRNPMRIIILPLDLKTMLHTTKTATRPIPEPVMPPKARLILCSDVATSSIITTTIDSPRQQPTTPYSVTVRSFCMTSNMDTVINKITKYGYITVVGDRLRVQAKHQLPERLIASIRRLASTCENTLTWRNKP